MDADTELPEESSEPGSRWRVWNATEVRQIAAAVRRMNTELSGLIESFDEDKFVGTLEVEGSDRMLRGLKYTTTWIGKIKAAYDSASLPTAKVGGGQKRKSVLDSVPDSGSRTRPSVQQTDRKSKSAPAKKAKKPRPVNGSKSP